MVPEKELGAGAGSWELGAGSWELGARLVACPRRFSNGEPTTINAEPAELAERAWTHAQRVLRFLRCTLCRVVMVHRVPPTSATPSAVAAPERTAGRAPAHAGTGRRPPRASAAVPERARGCRRTGRCLHRAWSPL